MVTPSPQTFGQWRSEVESLGLDLTPAVIASSARLASSAFSDTGQSDEVLVHRDLSYGFHERHRLDVYCSVDEACGPAAPVLVYVHGGAFAVGDKGLPNSPFFQNIGHWAVAQGFRAVIINYRLLPEASWPSGAEDISLALEWVGSNIARFGGDPARVVLVGQSAGAMHAADYIAHPEFHAPTAPALAGGALVSCLYELELAPDAPTHFGYWGADRSRWHAKSSIDGLLETSLPLLFTVSEFDELHFQQQAAHLVSSWYERHHHYPPLHVLDGQNHLTSVYAVGTPFDTLGPILRRFIDQVG